ncbi:transcriptional regulator [Photobacterium aquae]|uniref:HTH-type transcriptional regulator CueR n=1 Tax=Photobacterium aquae TaxID=1195763 RepID=A0A0J1K4I0_9GAMM|nr:Cu(I)-responsive transcriptional regulator [Photobacterium aquae]KLV09307.1 transcriptional regulator [Photobacterium aquae]
MNISEVAQLTGLTAKTIRFYEDKGIISPPQRAANGYRLYGDRHVNELLLVRRSRLVGFTLDESRELLAFSRDPQRRSADVKAKAEQKLHEIDAKINELVEMKQTLATLVNLCPGDDGAECPIIEGLCCESHK